MVAISQSMTAASLGSDGAKRQLSRWKSPCMRPGVPSGGRLASSHSATSPKRGRSRSA